VKIDKSFITGLRTDGDDVAIVRAIVDLGRHLGLDVVAEGVEDQATWDLLVSMGCTLVWDGTWPVPCQSTTWSTGCACAESRPTPPLAPCTSSDRTRAISSSDHRTRAAAGHLMATSLAARADSVRTNPT
jgi:predicted signal transduction protein with EAL and GGDEF domain